MAVQPPSLYSPYPRADLRHDPDKILLLYKAYTNIYWLIASAFGMFGIGVVLIVSLDPSQHPSSDALVPYVLVLWFTAYFVANYFVAYRCTKMLAKALDKGTGFAIGIAAVSSILSVFLYGVGGCLPVQIIAANEMKTCGVPSSFGGVKKAQVMARVEQLRTAQRMPYAAPPPPPM